MFGLSGKICLCLILVVVLVSCRQETPPAAAGAVEANAAYKQYFGEPPQPASGRAYARVGYLPLSGQRLKLRAVPLYLFDEDDQLAKILSRLTDGTLVLPPRSTLYNPFPEGLQLNIAADRDKTLTLALKMPQVSSSDLLPLALALTETAAQFAAVDRVIVLFNGQPLKEMPDDGFEPDRQRIVAVAPPELIMLAGMWNEGATAPEELMANFDRPVKVQSFHLSNADGSRVAGQYFTSAFQMAVIIHPENPGIYQEGITLVAEWEVTDALGRVGRGRDSLPIRRYEHAAHLNEFSKKNKK